MRARGRARRDGIEHDGTGSRATAERDVSERARVWERRPSSDEGGSRRMTREWGSLRVSLCERTVRNTVLKPAVQSLQVKHRLPTARCTLSHTSHPYLCPERCTTHITWHTSHSHTLHNALHPRTPHTRTSSL